MMGSEVDWIGTAGLVLSTLSAFSALGAAGLWLASARVSTPVTFNIHVVKPDMEPFGGNPLGGTYMGNAYSEGLTNLADALKRQSRLSAYGAVAAAMAAVLQTLQILTVLVS